MMLPQSAPALVIASVPVLFRGREDRLVAGRRGYSEYSTGLAPNQHLQPTGRSLFDHAGILPCFFHPEHLMLHFVGECVEGPCYFDLAVTKKRLLLLWAVFRSFVHRKER